ncbi:amino acid adenylation domain-containing protein [Pseudomonas sp. CCM 7891]|uniref:Amino acid adenylation domain-containing protein n=1 Tax=Pseudomonas karstica TaxID=1055468 RepID=A0A7X2UXJ4_9PSED|nr:non-ribosomal peptide synthetase [Pseudomonas karstica]MTD18105.1 amino acid adenylation domain-containing protein [Pseudomonas karstica]
MSTLTIEHLREQIGALLQRGEAMDDQANLIELGLDSLHLMRLVNQWRQAGASVTFADLIEQPTLAYWLPRLTATPRKAVTTAVVIDPTAPFALTDVQHAYWVGRGAEQVLGGVGCHAYLELDGSALDPQRLASAWQALQQWHGMLRARFDDEGRQQVLEHGMSALQVHDLRTLAPAAREQSLLDIRDGLSHRQLAVEQGEVAGLQLSLLPDGRTRLHFDLDLLVADVHSLHLILRDLAALYRGESLPKAAQGWHFAHYLAQRPVPAASAAHYWQARLDQLPAGPALPLACEPETVQQVRFSRRQQRLSPQVWQRLRDGAAKRQLTPAMLLAGAFAQVLGRWSQEPHFLLNLPLFDRQGDTPGLDQVVADFTNLLLLEVDLRQPGSIVQQLTQLQAQFHRDVAHAEYSGVQVQRDLAQRGAGQRSFSPVVFACNLGAPLLGHDDAHTLGALTHMISQTPQVWLDHQVYEEDGALLLAWDAQDALFPEGLVDDMFDAYLALLHDLQHDSTWDAPALPHLPEHQQHLRQQVNATDTPIAPRTLLQAPFALNGERLALIDGDRRISYAQLQQGALRIAAALLEHGVQPGEAVGVCMPRGHQAVLALYGVLAAGACYVPISPSQPLARRERICQLAAINTLIDPHWLHHALTFEPLPAPMPVSPDSPAYVIFTSGSTGDPKGVEVSHRAACNTLDDLNQRFGIGADDRLLAVSALDFDLSVYDLFGVLAVGGAVVLLEENQRRDAGTWKALIHQHQVTLWNSVPLLLDMLLTEAEDHAQPLPLRMAWLSGDWIGLDLPARLHAASNGQCRMIAMGGATEAAIWSNYQPVDLPLPAHWRSIPYGKPLGNQQYRVVDSLGRDCPDWLAGELWIGGAGVANGYRGTPQLSAERFVEHQGSRWYRTGDLGRYWPDGCLEFLGRRDHQVKVRGHRIELGEIENALLLQPQVRQAVALAIGTPLHLLAAVVPTEGSLCIEALRQQLSTQLPDYMLPSQWLLLDDLPLSANGKLDRRALVELAGQTAPQQAIANEAPCGEHEQQVAAIWRELLPGAEVYRQSDFFRLGGDSLLATQCSARLRRAGLANAQSLRQLFAMPRLAEFVAQLQAPGVHTELRLVADPGQRHLPFPLTEVQQAYWRGQSQGLPLSCGTTYLIELDGEALDIPRFEQAWDRLIQRHEMLRAQLVDDDRQVILCEVAPMKVQVHQASNAEAARQRLAECWVQRPRQRSQWPMFEVHVVGYGEGRCRAGLFFDYLTLDGLSIKRLLAELALLYIQPDTQLPAIDLSFRDYVLQVQPDPATLEQARAYWHARLDDLPGPPALPLHGTPQQLAEVHFSRREFRLPAPQWQALRQRARDSGITASVLLLSVYSQALARWSDGQAHTLNLTLFDRQDVHPHIGRVLGDFTSLAPVSFYPQPQASFLAQAQAVQAQVADVLQHAACSSIWVQRERARRIGPQAAALPVVFTSTLGLADDLLEDLPAGFPDIAAGGLSETPQVWLDHQLYEHRGALVLCWDAVDALFPKSLLDAAFASYTQALQVLIDADWHAPLALPLPDNQAQVRAQANASAVAIAPRTLLDAPFSIDSQRLALIDGDRRVSYGQLRECALRVAGWLQTQGVQPEDAIGVHLPRGTDAVIALFGVLAVGACYVPMGVRQPLERRQRIEQRAGIRLTLDADSLAMALDSTALSAPVAISVDSPAYVIFTSGSTGEPKGVQISHRAACNTLDDLNQRFAIGAEDRLLAVSALDFDLSVYDLFGVLAVGGSVVLLDEEQRRDATVWNRLIQQHQVTLWNSVPMLLDMLLTVAETLPLRQAWLSGDWIGLDLPARLHAASNGQCRMIAMGGATEAAIWSNYQPVDLPLPKQWRSIPYGRPLGNQCYRVVDAQEHDCPDWVTGELWIGGRGVAMGYRGALELSAERFVTRDDQRWYRTGDMGRYWPDGSLEFLGRRDQQVKVRGHRIELGEIDNALLACPQVRQALTVTLGCPPSLAAAVVVDGEVSLEVLRQQLRQRLPDYMIPASLQILKALPLSANGKADRGAVHQLLLDCTAERSDAPQGTLETEMAEVWAEVLQRPIPGRHSDFFLLGGDSLSATRLVETLKRRRLCQAPLSLRELFAHPSIAALCDYLGSHTERPLHLYAEHFEEGTL